MLKDVLKELITAKQFQQLVNQAPRVMSLIRQSQEYGCKTICRENSYVCDKTRAFLALTLNLADVCILRSGVNAERADC